MLQRIRQVPGILGHRSGSSSRPRIHGGYDRDTLREVVEAYVRGKMSRQSVLRAVSDVLERTFDSWCEMLREQGRTPGRSGAPTLLYDYKEESLAAHVKLRYLCGLPMDDDEIKARALDIMKERPFPPAELVAPGRKWVKNLLARNGLQLRSAQAVDPGRAGLASDAIYSVFDRIEDACAEYGLSEKTFGIWMRQVRDWFKLLSAVSAFSVTRAVWTAP